MEAATWISVLAAIVAAGAAIWLAFIGQRQIKMGQQQLVVSQKQVYQTLEALYDNRRPILVPLSQLPLGEREHHRYFDVHQAECPLVLRNVGSGIALNIRAVIYPPQPPKSPAYLTSHQTLWLGEPLEAGASIETATEIGKTIVPGTMTIGEGSTVYMLYAPQPPTPGEMLLFATPYRVARLTITYHNVYGRKHASVFDYTDLGLWQCAGIACNIPRDIEDLDQGARESLAREQQTKAAALVAEIGVDPFVTQ